MCCSCYSELCEVTSIRKEDVVSTLQNLQLIVVNTSYASLQKYWMDIINQCQRGRLGFRGVATIEATEAAASVNEETELEMKLQKIEIL